MSENGRIFLSYSLSESDVAYRLAADLLNAGVNLWMDNLNIAPSDDWAEGIKQAEIVSAFPMDETTQKNLVADLERKFGCRIDATIRLDPELIGGVRIAIGDEVIDASVRGKLAAMAATLKN